MTPYSQDLHTRFLRGDATPQSGNALLTALILLTVATAGAAAFLGAAVHASEGTTKRADRFETTRGGRSVNKIAAQMIWSSYERNLGGTEPSVAGLRAFLSAQGFTDQPGGSPARVEVLNRLALPLNDAGVASFGDAEIDSVLIHRVDTGRATRLVVTTSTRARRGIRGREGDVATAETDVFNMEPARWDGMDFALLANNINCIMCHTNVDDARRVYEGSLAADAGDYQRARVGSIESFRFREDPDSTIAGTLYLGGPAIDPYGDLISNWAALNLKGAQLDSEGRLIENGLGDLLETDLTPADMVNPVPYENLYVDYLDLADPVDGTLPETFPLPFRDDGGVDLATGTPTPTYADNRVVDDNEFDTTVADYNGSVSGGKVSIIAPGDRITNRAALSTVEAGTDTALSSVTDGNVVLTGTDSDPIQISGRVAIDGDLIISGPIEGTGSLWVRGNIYVRGDLEYADGMMNSERQFGVSPRGVSNALAMTAGGNMVIGNPYRPQWGEGASVTGERDGSWNFTLGETASFNRREWIKTQPTLPGLPEPTVVGTRTVQRERFQDIDRIERRPIGEQRDTGRTREVPVFDDVQTGTREEPIFENVLVPGSRPAPYGTPTYERRQTGTREVPVFERRQVGTRTERIFETVTTGYEDVVVTDTVPFSPRQFDDVEEPIIEMVRPQHPNPEYRGASFIPRYYAFGEGDPVPIQNVEGYFDPSKELWIADERVDSWDETKLTIADPNDPSDPTLYPASRPNAVIETLEPSGEWIDPALLEEFITDSLSARDADKPLTVDATLYSANSIFGLVPNTPSEGTGGAFRVEGSILSADIGLLAPEGTDVLYDPRSQAVLDIRDESKLSLVLEGALPAPRPRP